MSIIQTQPLIRRGAKWIIGNDYKVRVWKDNWLIEEADTAPTGPGVLLYPELLVKDLFIPGTNIWNEHIIRHLVREKDACKIYLWGLVNMKSGYTWGYNNWGIYTAKSGILSSKCTRQRGSNPQDPPLPQSQVWTKTIKKIWRANVRPKIKTFWWTMRRVLTICSFIVALLKNYDLLGRRVLILIWIITGL